MKWDSIVLAIATFFYGLKLYMFPPILQSYRVYQLVDELFDYRIISGIFMVLGIAKLLGVITNRKHLKRWSLVLLTFFWMLFGVSFTLSDPPNTIGILSLAMAFLAMGIAIKED